MTRRFGDAATELCGIASQLLGWRPAEFWVATPAELTMALRPPGADEPSFDTGRLAELRRQFPDD